MKPPSPPRMPSRLSDVLNHLLSTYALAECAALLMVVLVFGTSAQAQTFATLYSFTGTDGEHPNAGVVEDRAGNLYSTTPYGGHYNGVVFKVSSSGTETVLHYFGSADGANPYSPVIRDNKGNLYGTTWGGGTSSQGTIFVIDAAGKQTVLHSFAGGTTDGCFPGGGLAMDKYGSLYGTTSSCGADNYGTLFKLGKKGAYTLLHSFAGRDGAYPGNSSPILGRQGNIYGVTFEGGRAGAGVVYKLTKRRIKVLYAFRGATDGCSPSATPAMDKAGNLYGTTSGNGCSGNGTVWKVSPKGAETILHSFAGGTTDGCNPYGGVVRDPKGNLYGTTFSCGAYNAGTVWELSGDTLTLLHSFSGSDGLYPNGDLLRDSKGGLYGTAHNGGTEDYGTVWSYMP
jgi:uncharacterized repeat protein (TIGR03803 family)